MFSRTAVACMVLGFMALLVMAAIAVYKSNQRKQQLITGSRKSMLGMSWLCYLLATFVSSNPQGWFPFYPGPPKLVILHMDMAIHTFDDIMRSTENLSEKHIVGYGASSTVYKGALKNSRPIAIKRLYNQYPHNLREFETELETIGSIRHRNIVSLHGYALSPYGNLLFYDYMVNGSLWDLLHGQLSCLVLYVCYS